MCYAREDMTNALLEPVALWINDQSSSGLPWEYHMAVIILENAFSDESNPDCTPVCGPSFQRRDNDEEGLTIPGFL